MKQKVIKIGSSVGVVILKPIAKNLGIKAGDWVNLKVEGDKIIVTPLKTKPKIDPKIIAWVDEFMEKNQELLLRLTDKTPEEIAAWLEKNSRPI